MSWTFIWTASSADEALVAIRVAQRDLFEAMKSQHIVKIPDVDNAEGALNLAWAALKEKRYEEAILAARKANQMADKVR